MSHRAYPGGMPARPEPMVVHLAHFRPDLPQFSSIPPRVNDDWMLLLPLRRHRFRCRLGHRDGGPALYVIPPGFPFAAEMADGYRHYSAHFSDAAYVGWDETSRRANRVSDASWARRTLLENPVTLTLADASWRLATDAARRADLVGAFARLVARFQAGDAFRSRLALTQLLERAIAGSEADPLERIRPFADHLAWRVHEPATVSALARACGISRMQLHRLCRQAYGAGPKELLLRERLALARQLLERGQSVRVAAEASGFEDPYYFSRLFARRMGRPPSRWPASGG